APTASGARRRTRCGWWSTPTRPRPAATHEPAGREGRGDEQSATGAGGRGGPTGGPDAGAARAAHAGRAGAGHAPDAILRAAHAPVRRPASSAGALRPRRRVRVSAHRPGRVAVEFGADVPRRRSAIRGENGHSEL